MQRKMPQSPITPPRTPPLSRQDATLSEQKYPVRQKTTYYQRATINWAKAIKDENKENIPPQNDEAKDPQHDLNKKEGHDAHVHK